MQLSKQPTVAARGRLAPWLVVVFVAGAAVLLFDRQERSAAVERERLEKRVAELEQRLSQHRGRTSDNLATILGEVDERVRGAEGSAQAEVRRNSERLAGFVASRQREQQEMFLQELGAARGAVEQNQLELAQMQTTVAGMRGEVAAVDGRLAVTVDTIGTVQVGVADLRGAVDGHASRLDALSRQVERDVTPFRLARSKQRVRLGDVSVRLKDADPQRNRFTLELLADDRLVTHKHRALLEPIEFYSFTGELSEIVVTRIDKDRVEGYLARPQHATLASSDTP